MATENKYLGRSSMLPKQDPAYGMVAYKKNYLHLESDGTLVLYPTFVTRNKPIALWLYYRTCLIDTARCMHHETYMRENQNPVATAWKEKTHTIPAKKCTCGFHGYRNASSAFAHNPFVRERVWDDLLVFEVAVSGKYIEHEKGYRFENQRVKSIILGDCGFLGCYCKADRFALLETGRVVAICGERSSWHKRMFLYEVKRLISAAELISLSEKSLSSLGAPPLTVQTRYSDVELWIEPEEKEEPEELSEQEGKDVKPASLWRKVFDWLYQPATISHYP